LNRSNFDRAINPHTTDFAHEMHTRPTDADLSQLRHFPTLC